MSRIKKVPIKFSPYLKPVVWGGRKICEYKSLPEKLDNIGESWEISAIPGYETKVSEGEYEGLSLEQLITLFKKDLLGEKSIDKYGLRFPLLIKFIDAHDNLSVQVHPDDKLAQQRHNSPGKTEMWYFIRTEEDSKIIAGFDRIISRDEYFERVSQNKFLETLAVHSTSPGDLFYLPAGSVHAIGAGNLLLEIQESSDITYRIYDYNRRDNTGRLRELHTELAADAINFDNSFNYRIEYNGADPIAKLLESQHFIVRKLAVKKEMDISLEYESFTVIVCVKGGVIVKTEEGEIKLEAGNSILLPSVVKKVKMTGDAELVSVNV